MHSWLHVALGEFQNSRRFAYVKIMYDTYKDFKVMSK